MNVRDIMCSPVHTCHASDSMDAAARLMWEHDCGSVPVVDDGNCVVGVITDRDICMAAYTQGLPLTAMPVSSAMSPQVHACSMLDALDEVQSLMREHRVRRVPVVDDGQRVVGIVSLNDIALAAKDGLGRGNAPVTAESLVVLMGSVCEPRTARQGAEADESSASDGAAARTKDGSGRTARTANAPASTSSQGAWNAGNAGPGYSAGGRSQQQNQQNQQQASRGRKAP